MSKKIKVTKNGPYQVSGDVPLAKEDIILDKDGMPIKWEKGEKFPETKEYFLCRCGKSKNKPFCDQSHLKNNFDGTETAGLEDFKNQEEKIKGPGLTLGDASSFCAGAGFCDRAGGTWNLTRQSQNEDFKKMAIDQACNCPSGRLVAYDKESGEAIEPKFDQEVSLVECSAADKSGPIWVKGKIPIESSEGKEYELRNRVTLCRCGKSKNKPFCDASHTTFDFNDKK